MITPFSRYGAVPLEILTEEDGRIVDWHRDLVINYQKVAASNRTLYQADGWADWEYAPRILVRTAARWQELSRSRGIRANLWIPADATTECPPDEIEPRQGQDYARFQSVLLVDLQLTRRTREGFVIGRATFRRGNQEEYQW